MIFRTPMQICLLAFSALAPAVTLAQAKPAAPPHAVPTKPVMAHIGPIELDADRKPTIVTGGNCLIKNGTVITVSGDTQVNSDVLVRGGKVERIGKGLSAPAGFAVIDATGRYVSPGIIDAHSHIASDAINEGTDSITAEVRIEDVLDPRSLSIWRGLSNGVTTSLLLHGSANAIGGQSVVVKMRYNRTAADLPFAGAPRMIKFALGENVKRPNQQPGESARYPLTRLGVESVYRRAFAEAKAYQADWNRYEKARLQDPDAVPPRRDLRLEALSDVLQRKIWVQCHCYRADEMLMMVRLSQEFGFKIGALQHALEAYKIAPELAAAHIPISTFADAWAYKIEAFDAIPYNAAMCLHAGIIASVNSDNTAGTYRLNLEAAKAMRFGGLTEAEAWKLITSNPAIQLGVDKMTGTLEPGKDADIAIWEGHPFSVSSKCMMTLVDGEVFFQRRDAFGVDKSAYVQNALKPPVNAAFEHLPSASSYAIVGATVHPVSAPSIPNGIVVVENGQIVAVGAKASIPRGAVVVRAKGMHVYPGLIDAGSVLGLDEIGQVPATSDTTEGGLFQPDLKAVTAVNAASEHILIARAEGLTVTRTRPSGGGGFRGSGTVIAGQGSVIALDGWTPELMSMRGPATLQVAYPEGAGRLRAFSRFLPPDFEQRQKDARKEAVQKLTDYFDRAERYSKAMASGVDMVREPQMDAMAPFVTGKAMVVFTENTAAGIRKAVEFGTRYKLKMAIETGAEALQCADLLVKNGIPVIYRLHLVNSLDTATPPNEYDPYDTIFAVPGQLVKAGVKLCFASNSAANAKNLPFQVGITRGFGLSEEQALRALTLDAATVLGVGDRVGSLETGKTANLIISDGDPLEIRSRVAQVFIGGKPVSLETRHTRLYQKYMERLVAPNVVGRATAAR